MQLPHEFALLMKLMVFFAQYLTLFTAEELGSLGSDFAAAAAAFASTHVGEMRELVPPPQRAPLVKQLARQASVRAVDALRSRLRNAVSDACATLNVPPLCRLLRRRHVGGSEPCAERTGRAAPSTFLGRTLAVGLLAIAALEWHELAALGATMANSTVHSLGISFGQLNAGGAAVDSAGGNVTWRARAVWGRHSE